MTVRIRFQPGLKPIIEKHAMHDQSSHGSWARGGNKLNTEEIMANHIKTDGQVKKIYDAERTIFKDKRTEKLAPEFGKKREDFETEQEYKKAFKEYLKEWDYWARNEAKQIQSKLGEKHLNGTPKGVKEYVNAVLETDYWKETFGSSPIGKPVVKSIDSKNQQGRWEIGRKLTAARGWEYINNLAIDRIFTMNEATILHELAHFGTAITQTNRYEPHGAEFARNYINITTNIAGVKEGNQLRNAYIKSGVEIAD
jgi:putative metallohydrolase (TIGR04338 family)